MREAWLYTEASCYAGPQRRPACALCPVSGGLMRRTTCGHWVHATCALWTPGTWINCETGFVEGLSKLPKVGRSQEPRTGPGLLAVNMLRVVVRTGCRMVERASVYGPIDVSPEKRGTLRRNLPHTKGRKSACDLDPQDHIHSACHYRMHTDSGDSSLHASC